jgi:hypothetical protein
MLAAVAVGIILLGHLTPVAAGMLLCIGDGSDPDCCDYRPDSRESRLQESTRLSDGSDCGCCITVDATPSTAVVKLHEASVNFAPRSALLRNVSSPTGTRIPAVPPDNAFESSISSSLRTVVLLI